MAKEIPSILLLICLFAVPTMGEDIYSPSLPDIAKSFGSEEGAVQFTVTIYLLGLAASFLFWGRLSDTIGRRKALIFGYVFFVIGSFGCYFAESMTMLLAGRFLQAFGGGGGMIVTQTMIRECFKEKRLARVISIMAATLSMAPIFGTLLGGWIDQFYGFRSVFLVVIFAGVIMLGYAIVKLPETIDPERKKVKLSFVFMKLIRDPYNLSLCFLIGAINGMCICFFTETPFIFIDFFHRSPLEFGFIGGISGLTVFFGGMFSNWQLKFKSSEQLIVIGVRMMFSGIILLNAIVWVFEQPTLLYGVAFLAAMFVIFLGASIASPNCFGLILKDYQAHLGTSVALFGLGYWFISSIITAGMSLLHNGSLQVMPLYFVVVMLVIMLVVRMMVVKKVTVDRGMGVAGIGQ